jgi:hypothetical protein
VLVTVFAADREAEATLLHAVGAAGQLVALLQVRSSTSYKRFNSVLLSGIIQSQRLELIGPKV